MTDIPLLPEPAHVSSVTQYMYHHVPSPLDPRRHVQKRAFGPLELVGLVFLADFIRMVSYIFETSLKVMYHQPSVRKQPKRYSEQEAPVQDRVNFIQRNKQAPLKKPTENSNQPSLPRINNKASTKTIPQKVEQLEKVVERLAKGSNPPELQRLLLQEIQGIKSELKEIKQQIGIGHGEHHGKKEMQGMYREEQEEREEAEEQNIYDIVPREYQEVRQPPEVVRQSRREESRNEQRVQSRMVQSQGQGPISYQTYQKKVLLDIGKIQPYMKEFKLEGSKIPLTIYPGYHKKSSKPVVIKYCGEQESIEPLLGLYQRLWKNIVKAKKVCINKVYDLNEPMANNMMALEMNQYSLTQIPLPPQTILRDTLRAIQFLHQCGLLYRDLHPSHVMQSYDGNIVLLGLRRSRRYSDIKGRMLQVKATPQETPHEFVSNARLRGVPEGRKDDLQTLGYLALYLLEGRLPWAMPNILQVRGKATLQGLFGRHGRLLEFMAAVYQMSTDQQPNYDHLMSLIVLEGTQ